MVSFKTSTVVVLLGLTALVTANSEEGNDLKSGNLRGLLSGKEIEPTTELLLDNNEAPLDEEEWDYGPDDEEDYDYDEEEDYDEEDLDLQEENGRNLKKKKFRCTARWCSYEYRVEDPDGNEIGTVCRQSWGSKPDKKFGGWVRGIATDWFESNYFFRIDSTGKKGKCKDRSCKYKNWDSKGKYRYCSGQNPGFGC